MAILTSTHHVARASRPQPFLALGCLLAACTLSTATYAADNPGAHEHGHARLQIAVENNSVDLMFTSPAYNLAGFEHEARTDEEKQRLAEINQWLNTTPLVNTGSANCRVTAATVELGGDMEEEHDHEGEHHDDHHDEDHHGHDDHDKHHDDDHHDHDEQHEKEATHREYDVSQQLECDMGTGQEFTSALMAEFEHLKELAVEWVSPSGQGSARLTPSNRTFTIND